MSADNFVGILVCKDQSRVMEGQAVDNLWFSWTKPFNSSIQKGDVIPEEILVPTRIVEYFKNSLPMKKEDAISYANQLVYDILDDFGILEYGIQTFVIDKTWDETVKEARDFVKKEIKAVKKIYKGRNDILFPLYELEDFLEGYFETIIEEE